jgi:hypothetical protein
MSESHPRGYPGSANGSESGRIAALRAADWLSLAAAPVFAFMALIAGVFGADRDVLCSAAHGSSPLNEMVVMYLLMSAFHSTPWLKLVFGR